MKSLSRYFIYVLIPIISATLGGCKFLNSISFELPSESDYIKRLVVHDVVRNSHRLHLTFRHTWITERATPFRVESATWLKEQFQTDSAIYKVQVKMELDQFSYPLEDSIYFILGDEVFPFALSREKSAVYRYQTPQTEKVLLTDSTEMEVITGIKENSQRVELFDYEVGKKAIELIASGRTFSYRYYIGAHSMTIYPTASELRWLTSMINMNLTESPLAD